MMNTSPSAPTPTLPAAAPLNRPGRPVWALAIFVLVAVSSALIWYSAVKAYEAAVIKERQRELLAISELKIDYIRQWMAERRGDAGLAAMSPLVAKGVDLRPADALREGSPAANIVVLLEAIRQAFGYETVILADAEGRVRLAAGPPALTEHVKAEQAVRAAVSAQQTVVSRFYSRPEDTHVDLDIIAPITIPDGAGRRAVGAIVLHIDPGTRLYPILTQWPSPSQTAESLLVDRAGDEVIYLSPLRQGAQFGLRAPVAVPLLPAAMAARGERGLREGVDYRGAEVFAAIGQVPDTTWVMIAKVDRDEVLAPVRRQALWSGGLTAALLAAAGVATLLWWRRQQTEYILAAREGIELTLRGSEARFRKLIENAWDFTAILDRNMVVHYESPSIRRQLGFGAAGKTGRLTLRYVHPDDLERVRNAYAAALAQPNQPQVITHRLQRADGAWLQLEAVVTNHLDDPDIGGLVVNSRDITARMAAEQSQRESAERFRTVFEHAPVGLVLSGPDGLLRLPNPALARMLGYTQQELAGMSFLDVTHPEDASANVALRHQLFEGKIESFTLEKRYVRKDGSAIWANLVVGLIRDAHGGPDHAIAIVQDITERKEAEQKRLEFARQQRDTLVREVHHRIKNHLQGLAGLLRQHIFRQPVLKEQLEAVVAQINAIAIVHGLQGREKTGAVWVGSLVRDIVGFLGGITTVRLEAHIPECTTACTLAEDESVPIALILNELVTNAVRHGRPAEGEAVTVTVLCDDSTATITIRNRGGYPAGLDFAAGKGLGTGLTLIRSLLPAAGASISIGPAQKGWVEVRLRLGPPVLLQAREGRQIQADSAAAVGLKPDLQEPRP